MDKVSYEKCSFCLNCFNKFATKEKLEKHQELCCMHKPRIEKATELYEWIGFSHPEHQHKQPFIAYLDFECVLPKEKNTKCTECWNLKCKCDRSYTKHLTSQIPIGYSFVILNKDEIIHEKTYFGENAADHFIDHLIDINETWLDHALGVKTPLEMTETDNQKFDASYTCYMCNKDFDDCDRKKVRDHCHFTGNFIGAACNKCNLRRRRPKNLKIFVHNGSRYDFHFIIKALSGRTEVKGINVLPYNSENFRTIKFLNFEFNDSLAFLQSSLNQLSEDLYSSNHKYPIIQSSAFLKNKRGCLDKKKWNCC